MPQLDLLPPSTTRWTRYLTIPADFHQLTAAALIALLSGTRFGLSSDMSPMDWSSLPSLMLNVDQDSGMVERSAGPNQGLQPSRK